MARAAGPVTTGLPPVGTLWMGGPLNWIARLGLQSFVNRGHQVMLFSYGDGLEPGVEGVEVIDARNVFDAPQHLRKSVTASILSDLFRLHLMVVSDAVWVDTDVLGYRRLKTFDGYLVGHEESRWINGAVLRLPQTSPALAELIDCLSDPGFVPDWLHPETRRKAEAAPADQRLYEACRLIPNAAGPRALTHMMKKHGEDHHALPHQVLNPLPWSMADVYFNPHGGVEGWLTDDTLTLHLYTSRIRSLHRRVRPRQGSFMRRFADEVGFDFADLPESGQG